MFLNLFWRTCALSPLCRHSQGQRATVPTVGKGQLCQELIQQFESLREHGCRRTLPCLRINLGRLGTSYSLSTPPLHPTPSSFLPSLIAWQPFVSLTLPWPRVGLDWYKLVSAYPSPLAEWLVQIFQTEVILHKELPWNATGSGAEVIQLS